MILLFWQNITYTSVDMPPPSLLRIKSLLQKCLKQINNHHANKLYTLIATFNHLTNPNPLVFN